MAGRTLVIGDIHGCLVALKTLLAELDIQKEDTLILLGDYVDRGPDSAGVIERLIQLKEECSLYPILGNHDELMLDVIDEKTWNLGKWLMYGGQQTLHSYGVDSAAKIPKSHSDFLRTCVTYCESEKHFFVHANYQETKPLDKMPPEVLRWESLNDRTPGPHVSGKTAVMGHTAQKNGEILYQGYLLCLDTYCYGSGSLTAFNIDNGEFWKTDKNGEDVTNGLFRIYLE